MFARRIQAMFAVSMNTVREAIRSKVFGSLIFFAVLLILSSLVLGEMSLHNEGRIARDVSLFASMLFATSIAIYSSITMFYVELERRTVYTILSKPIPRWLFLLGKWLGVQLLMAIVLTGMCVISAITISYQGEALTRGFFLAYLTIFYQLMIVTALAHFFATIAAPLLAGFASAALFVGGNLFSQLKLIRKLLAESGNALEYIIVVLEYTLPNLESLNLSYEFTYDIPIPGSYLLHATIYTLSYSTITLLLAVAAFSTKDIS